MKSSNIRSNAIPAESSSRADRFLRTTTQRNGDQFRKRMVRFVNGPVPEATDGTSIQQAGVTGRAASRFNLRDRVSRRLTERGFSHSSEFVPFKGSWLIFVEIDDGPNLEGKFLVWEKPSGEIVLVPWDDTAKRQRMRGPRK